MQYARQLVTLLITSPVFAWAQSQPVVAHSSPSTANCPVMVTAKYIPGAALRSVNPAENTPAREPLHVSFGSMTQAGFGSSDPGLPVEVREAQVTVRGITERGGVIPAGVTTTSSPWIEKTFTVNINRNAAGLLTSTIWLTGFGGVRDVRIDTMTFADGKTWKAAGQQTCHAATGSILRSSK